MSVVDLTPTLTPAGRATWLALNELAARVPVNRWSVVGGQMVAIHAARFGVVPLRPTTDGDIVVDVRAFGRHTMTEIADVLLTLGFAVEMSPEGVTRFRRATAKIDLLAPDGVGANVLTSPPGHAVQAPGATQALERSGKPDRSSRRCRVRDQVSFAPRRDHRQGSSMRNSWNPGRAPTASAGSRAIAYTRRP